MADTNYRGPNYDLDYTYEPPVSLDDEEVPEVWQPDLGTGEELSELEPLHYLLTNEHWPLLDDYLGIREVKAVEALLKARSPAQVAALQERVNTIREFRRLPSTIEQAIDYLTSQIREEGDENT
jgi:hypothetical protein